MESIIPKNYSFKEKQLTLFSKKKNIDTIDSYHTKFPEISKYRISSNKNTKNGQNKEHDNKTLQISSISRSLKNVALSSKLYGNYVDFYSNLSQGHSLTTSPTNKCFLFKKKNYLSIKVQPFNFWNKEKTPFNTDINNSLFLSFLNETKSKIKFLPRKPHRFINYKNELKLDKYKTNDTNDSFDVKEEFGELWEKNLFESRLLRKLGLKNIDMENCFEEKQNNLNFLYEYLKKEDELKDFFNENNFHRNISFNERTAIKKENMEFNLDIYSVCFKFFSLDDNNTINKKSQKLYFPFTLMPLFYLLDFTSFKVLLSEIIIFNKTKNHFEYIEDNLLIKILGKYINYISNSLENKKEYINNITYNKKEEILPIIYDWFVTTYSLNEKEEKEESMDNNLKKDFINDYKCYKLKIVLPKTKFSVDNLNLKVIKFINKHLISNLLKNKFKKWELYIFFDLFSTKKFKIITNLIMLNKYYKIPLKKIKLNKKYKIENKDYEFFLTQIGENISVYYAFIPFIILTLFGEKDKKFQKINLSLKDSINLYKFGQKWGMINTLFKCMFLDTKNNRIFFKFELLEEYKNELYNIIKQKNKKSYLINSNNIKNKNLNNVINSKRNKIKKILERNKTIKEKDENQIKYIDSMYEISLQDCTLRSIIINSEESEDKYYIVTQKLLKKIFSLKEEKKLLNINFKEKSLISKFIGENIPSILSAKEFNNISEEKKMLEKADIEEKRPEKELPKIENDENQILRNQTSSEILQIFPPRNLKKKENVTEKIAENKKNSIKVEKRYSNKYIFPKGIFFTRSDKKRVSITNSNELNQNRLENIKRDIIKRRTMNFKNFN